MLPPVDSIRHEVVPGGIPGERYSANVVLPFPVKVRAGDMLSFPRTPVGVLFGIGYIASMAAVVCHNLVRR